jgi:hypothetical protein
MKWSGCRVVPGPVGNPGCLRRVIAGRGGDARKAKLFRKTCAAGREPRRLCGHALQSGPCRTAVGSVDFAGMRITSAAKCFVSSRDLRSHRNMRCSDAARALERGSSRLIDGLKAFFPALFRRLISGGNMRDGAGRAGAAADASGADKTGGLVASIIRSGLSSPS